MNNYRQKFINEVKAIGNRHTTREIFYDFLAVSAITLSNAVDKKNFTEREEQYFAILKKYSKEEFSHFPKLFGHLVMEMELHAEKPEDILGPLYTELDLNKKEYAQIFTPQCVSEMISKMQGTGIMTEKEEKEIQKKGYITVGDPSVGPGGMVLSFAGSYDREKYNYQKQMLVYATDIDIICVHMCYIQFCLYSVPACITHGNSLTGEVWSTWYTTQYVLGGWSWRTLFNNNIQGDASDEIAEDIEPKTMSEENPPSVESPAKPIFDIEIGKDGQVKLLI